VNGAIVLNGGDPGLLASLDKLSAEEASIASHQGTTVAAHAEHVRYGLLLMNTWAKQGGNPFAHARWQDAWKIITVDEPRWQEIRDGLRSEVLLWQEALRTPRDVAEVELSGMIGSVAHTAYHLGAIRQIVAGARGPKDPSPK
jgi:hypothetical protein